MDKNGFQKTSLLMLHPDQQPPGRDAGLPENAADLKEIILAVHRRPDPETIKRFTAMPNFTLQTYPGENNAGRLANLAASSARGRYLVFLFGENQPGKGWLADLLRPLIETGEAAAALPAGRPGVREENTGTGGTGLGRKWLLAPAGSAFAMRASRFRHIGGFDPDLRPPFSLCDLGFRLWLSGGRMAASGPPGRGVMEEKNGPYQIFREVRDRLRTIYKNYEDGEMARRLALNLFHILHRAAAFSGLDPARFAFSLHGDAGGRPLPRMEEKGLASLLGIQSLTAGLPRLRLKRKAVQRLRKVRDREIFSMVDDPFTVSGGIYFGDRVDWRALENILNLQSFGISNHG